MDVYLCGQRVFTKNRSNSITVPSSSPNSYLNFGLGSLGSLDHISRSLVFCFIGKIFSWFDLKTFTP